LVSQSNGFFIAIFVYLQNYLIAMKFIWFILTFFTLSIQAQFACEGVVRDEITNKTLPFATILINNKFKTVTDIDGKFTFNAETKLTSFQVKYVGYEQLNIEVTAKKFYTIRLRAINSFPLNDNLVAAILNKVVKNSNQNNPQLKLKSFEFKTYNKLIISANPDSIVKKLDSIFVTKHHKKVFLKIDSSAYKFKKIIEVQHLFQIEKVSQFQYDQKHLKETVIGLKMSGFKKPIYEIVGLNLQSFSVYDSNYELFETKYKSPIAKTADRVYDYQLLDSTELQNRKVYLIFFKPKVNKQKSLRGLLYVDAENFAIAQMTIRLNSILDITATHHFDYIPKEDLWFPSNKVFKIEKGINVEDMNVLGDNFTYENDVENTIYRMKQNSDYTYLESKTKNFDIVYNQKVNLKKPAIAIDIKDDAIKKGNQFWNLYRKDSLDVRSKKTYSSLDSINKKVKIDQKVFIGRKLINGFIPIGFVDLDLRHLLSYNNFEGFRVGLGGVTNEKMSKIFRLDGYDVFGTKDGKMKYSFGAAFRIGKFSNTWIGANYTDDIKEIGSTNFATDKRAFKIYDPRPINVSTFYHYELKRAYIETKIIPKTESLWQISQTEVVPIFDYIFNYGGHSYNRFNITAAMFALQWNPFSSYMQTPNGRVEIDKHYPKFSFQFTKTLPNVMKNDFNFGKIDIKAEYQKKFLSGQKMNVFAQMGYAFGAVPLTHLYNTSPNNLNKQTIGDRITFAGNNSFETMYFNEFFSEKYAMLQIKHGSKRVVIFKKVKPSLVFVTRLAIGTLSHSERHLGLNYKTLEKGFFESGIELNQIYKGFGLSGFYRYGPNQLARLQDNISLKLSFVLDLGL
jgi:hypothetical protein